MIFWAPVLSVRKVDIIKMLATSWHVMVSSLLPVLFRSFLFNILLAFIINFGDKCKWREVT